jgi:pimeloyl-ACP methyl ester carboxylesterase
MRVLELVLSIYTKDVVNVLRFEDLHDLMLIGDSFGGAVAAGVVDRVPERIAQLVYLDAFVPCDGEAGSDIASRGPENLTRQAKQGDGWRVPPRSISKDTSPADVKWMLSRRLPQALKTFTTKMLSTLLQTIVASRD